MPRLRFPTPRLLLAMQSAYLIVSGLWPLLSYRSFEAVSGRKTDDWLVKTVAGLILASGVALALAVRRGDPTAEARAVSLGTSTALGTSALWYGLRGRVPRVYLLEAAVEGVWISSLLAAMRRKRGDGDITLDEVVEQAQSRM